MTKFDRAVVAGLLVVLSFFIGVALARAEWYLAADLLQARVGAESHWMVTESGHSVSSHWLTVGGGVEVPLSW